MGELRRMSNGFQEEMRGAFDEVTRTPDPVPDAPSSPPKLEPVADDADRASASSPGGDGSGAQPQGESADGGEPEAGAKSDDPAA
jgi:hypothetical protein